MARVPDPVKQRREYLKQKRKVYRSYALLALVLILGPSVTIHKIYGKDRLPGLWGIDAFCVAGVFLLAAFAVWIDAKEANRQAQQSYVPPVTADTLPAEEVLVRSADQPPATPDTLLRAATSGEESQTAQLLRSSASEE